MTSQFKISLIAAAMMTAVSAIPPAVSQRTVQADSIISKQQNTDSSSEEKKKENTSKNSLRVSKHQETPSVSGSLKNSVQKKETLSSAIIKECTEIINQIRDNILPDKYVPSSSVVNLFYQFPEEENKTEAENLLYQASQRFLCLLNPAHHQYSMGARLFEKLNEKEQEWMYRIYHDLNSLPYRTSIHLQFLDNNGNHIEYSSNSQEILSLSSIYSYYHSWNDYEKTQAYAMKLWELSHQYDLSVGPVYYCDGCLEDEDSFSDMDEAVSESPSSQDTEQPKSLLENIAAGFTSNAAQPVAGGASETAGTSNEEPSGPASDSFLKTEQPKEALEETGETAADKAPEEAETSPEILTEKMVNEAAAENAAQTSSTSQTSDAASSSDSPSIMGSQSMAETKSGGEEPPTDCPGHVDVTVTVRIAGLDGENSLFSIAETLENEEGQEVKMASEMNPETNPSAWPGWNEVTAAEARNLAAQDWKTRYGLAAPEIAFGKTLSKEEYEAYMNLLPEEISSERKSLIAFALDSVGKVPYYYGGKPSCPGFDGNYFFSFVEPDALGRTLKGLDCSGWINWVYWSALGSPVTSAGTSSLAESGRAVAKEDLKPGDIAVVSGEDAHVVMFLGWDETTGNMICIHESAGSTNNVTVSRTSREWQNYRNLID